MSLHSSTRLPRDVPSNLQHGGLRLWPLLLCDFRRRFPLRDRLYGEPVNSRISTHAGHLAYVRSTEAVSHAMLATWLIRNRDKVMGLEMIGFRVCENASRR
jgi:hypothetical protein